MFKVSLSIKHEYDTKTVPHRLAMTNLVARKFLYDKFKHEPFSKFSALDFHN